MDSFLHLPIQPQPDSTTCGPTCLQAVYAYYGDPQSIGDVVQDVPTVAGGGTLAVLLGCHALQRGYRATIYTYNLQVFDPSWFTGGDIDVRERLAAQLAHKTDPKVHAVSEAYLQFLDLGGHIRFEDLTTALLCKYLERGVPVLTGLSATYLYHAKRETVTCEEDDIRGEPVGHFVVLCGYDTASHEVLIADPYLPNPMAAGQQYTVPIDRAIGSIFLGIVTHDANLLIIEPADREPAG